MNCTGNELARLLTTWDGKSAADIEAIFSRFCGQNRAEPVFIDALLSLLAKHQHSRGASWMLKRCIETGTGLNTEQTGLFFSTLGEPVDWQTRLHMLQSLPHLRPAQAHFAGLEHFVRKGLSDPNKFVRAWSYNGFYELAKVQPTLREEAAALLELGLRDEPASVRARIRLIKKNGGFDGTPAG